MASHGRRVRPGYVDIPNASFETEFTNYGQGLTYGWGHWFVVNQFAIWRIKHEQPGFTWYEWLKDPSYYKVARIVDNLGKRLGFDHLGDPSFDETTGLLYVPVEGTADNYPDFEKSVFVFDFDLNFLGWGVLNGFGFEGPKRIVPNPTKQIAAAWCAVRSGFEAAAGIAVNLADAKLRPNQRIENGVLFTTDDSTMATALMAYPLPRKDDWRGESPISLNALPPIGIAPSAGAPKVTRIGTFTTVEHGMWPVAPGRWGIPKVTGGCFGPSGALYLASEGIISAKWRFVEEVSGSDLISRMPWHFEAYEVEICPPGIHVIDMFTRTDVQNAPISIDLGPDWLASTFGGRGYELEGLAYLDKGEAGQLHLMIIDKDWPVASGWGYRDNMLFRHFFLEDGS